MQKGFYDRFVSKWSAFNRVELFDLFILFVVSKICVYALSLGLLYLSGVEPRFDMLFNWDAGFYMGIAESGYYSPASYAMAPLFPLTIRGFGELFSQNYQIAGVFTANLFSFLELVPAYMLFKYYSNKPGYQAALWLFFPLYFVWGLVPYTEHVFSFFVLCSWWCLKTDKKGFAIVLAALACLVRQTGVILFIPLFLYFVFKEQSVYGKIRYALASLLVPISTASWNVVAGWISGDPLAVVNAQQYFGASFAFEYIAKLDFKTLLDYYSTYTYSNHVAMPFLIVFIVLACFLLVPKIYKLDKYLAVYTFLNLALFLVFFPTTSTLRYLSALFPLFLVVNVKVNLKLYVPVCIVSSALMLYSFMQVAFIG